MSSRAYKAIKSAELLSFCPARLEFEFINALQKEIKKYHSAVIKQNVGSWALSYYSRNIGGTAHLLQIQVSSTSVPASDSS